MCWSYTPQRGVAEELSVHGRQGAPGVSAAGTAKEEEVYGGRDAQSVDAHASTNDTIPPKNEGRGSGGRLMKRWELQTKTVRPNRVKRTGILPRTDREHRAGAEGSEERW